MSKKSILLIGLVEPLNKQFTAALLGRDFVVQIQAEDSPILTQLPVPDLILLGLPSNGIDTLKHLRHWYKHPILVLSTEDREQQIIAALNAGANDYIHIPVRMPETLARIRAALRDRRPPNSPIAEFGNLTIDFPNRLVKHNKRFLKLSPIEYQLLVLLVRSENRVITSQYLVEKLWGQDQPESIKDLRVHIMHLRRKIERDAGKPEIILTEPKIGYKFINNTDLHSKP